MSRVIAVDPVPQPQRPASSRGGAGRGSDTRGGAPRRPRSGPRSGTAASRPPRAPRADRAATSTSPVRSCGFAIPCGPQRGRCPCTRTTSSAPSSWAAACAVGRILGMEHDLHHALAVAQVDEGDAAVVAAAGHPAAEDHLGVGVRSAGSSPHAWRPHRGPADPLMRSLPSSRSADAGETRRRRPSSVRRRRAAAGSRLPAASSRSPRIATNAAPARSAIFSCAFNGRSSYAAAAATPVARSSRDEPTCPRAAASGPTATTKHRGVEPAAAARPPPRSPAGPDPVPSPNPTPGVGGPPSASASPSYRPPRVDRGRLVRRQPRSTRTRRPSACSSPDPAPAADRARTRRPPRPARRAPPRSAPRTRRTGGR